MITRFSSIHHQQTLPNLILNNHPIPIKQLILQHLTPLPFTPHLPPNLIPPKHPHPRAKTDAQPDKCDTPPAPDHTTIPLPTAARPRSTSTSTENADPSGYAIPDQRSYKKSPPLNRMAVPDRHQETDRSCGLTAPPLKAATEWLPNDRSIPST